MRDLKNNILVFFIAVSRLDQLGGEPVPVREVQPAVPHRLLPRHGRQVRQELVGEHLEEPFLDRDVLGFEKKAKTRAMTILNTSCNPFRTI